MKLRYVCDKEMLVKEYFKYINLSHHLQKKIRNLDNIVINGSKAKNYYTIKKGDVLELEFNETINQEYLPNFNDHVKILYEDEYLLVISKPAFLSSMPSHAHPLDNVLRVLKAYFEKNGINTNIHLVNRLDYATSGLMIVSKSGICHYEVSKQEIIKKYLLEVSGKVLEDGIIEKPIKRENEYSIKRMVASSGALSITKYKVLKNYDDKTLIEATLVTGRCHQIRVHFASIDHPLLGDKLYNSDCNKDMEYDLHLHAYYLSFIHPFLNKKIELFDYPSWYVL